jgi:hypothetical protein
MSAMLLPSPIALSGSLLVSEISSMASSALQASSAWRFTASSRSVWSGGRSTSGVATAEITGGVPSSTCTST